MIFSCLKFRFLFVILHVLNATNECPSSVWSVCTMWKYIYPKQNSSWGWKDLELKPETRISQMMREIQILLSTWIHEPALIRWEPDTMDEALKGQRMTSNMTRWIKSPPSQVQCQKAWIYMNDVLPYLKHTNIDTDPRRSCLLSYSIIFQSN